MLGGLFGDLGVCECVCDCWLLYFLVLRLLRLIWFASNAVGGLDLRLCVRSVIACSGWSVVISCWI